MDDVLAVLAGRAQWAVAQGDAAERLAALPAGCVHVVVTSPPYYSLRDYGTGRWEGGAEGCDHLAPPGGGTKATGLMRDGRSEEARRGNAERVVEDRRQQYRSVCGKCGARRVDRQIGLEQTVDAYLARLAAVFDEVKRVLRDDGLLAVNIGDTVVEGNMAGVPERLCLLLQSRGWVWRAKICWRKPSPMPQSLAGWRWQRCRVKVQSGPMAGNGHPSNLPGGQNQLGQRLNDNPHQAQWADCPGCPRCERNDGLVLRKGSWRPTPSWEPVYLFSKTMGYFADGEPVRTRLSESSVSRDQYTRVVQNGKLAGEVQQNAMDYSHDPRSSPAGANLRDCWTIPAESLDEQHYAAFPSALVRQVLRFATSERGCCPGCGSPWARVVETRTAYHHTTTAKGKNEDGPYSSQIGNGAGTHDIRHGVFSDTTTLGWRQTCTCPAADPVGAVVLDPFAGSGRSGVAARQLGLRFVGFDLSDEYVALARRQIGRALRKTKRQKPGKKGAAPTLFDQGGG